jgi:hypothetical protein
MERSFAFAASVDKGTILGRDAAVHGILLFIQSSYLLGLGCEYAA